MRIYVALLLLVGVVASPALADDRLGTIPLDIRRADDCSAETAGRSPALCVPTTGDAVWFCSAGAACGLVASATELPIFGKSWEADPTAEEWVLPAYPADTTITRCDCEVYNGTSVTVSLCRTEDIGDDLCDVEAITTGLVCDAAGASVTGLSVNVGAREEITALVTAVSGVNTDGWVTCTGTLQ